MRSLQMRTNPALTVATLIAVDLLALAACAVTAVLLRYHFGPGDIVLATYWGLWPVLPLIVGVYQISGLYLGVPTYPSMSLGPVEELERLSLTTTGVFVGLALVTFISQRGVWYSRSIFVMAWLFCLVLVPLMRSLVRVYLAPRPWWGYGAVIFGAGETGALVARQLRKSPGLGLKVVAFFDDDPSTHGELEGVPVVGTLDDAREMAQVYKLPYAIIAMPGLPVQRLNEIITTYSPLYPHMLIIPDLFGFSSLWVAARDVGGVLGLEIRQRLQLPLPRLLKNTLQGVLTALVLVVCIPLVALIALLVRLDSPGPAFYSQERVGRYGKIFRAWKFRTMVQDAEEKLQEYLAANPEQQAEWDQFHKLRNDPRITRVGRLLRTTSLDELPQIFNVLKREMSLVGPRPIFKEDIAAYGQFFELYRQVRPGITGLWQVSGRNNLTHPERIHLDAYYVRNWSVWLDVYILVKTIYVVIKREGAY